MSRYNPHHEIAPILDAAQDWRRRCLQESGSIFGNSSVWSDANIGDLKRYFVDNPDEGEGSFIEKLERQLQEANPGVKQLASEMTWFMLLCPSNIGAENKRDTVRFIWSWARLDFPPGTPYLADPVLCGIGSAGTAFNTARWRELAYFVRVVVAFRALDNEQRSRFLKEGWALADWLDSQPDSNSRQFRHMLLYLLFPDIFERIFGGTNRRRVVRAFSGLSGPAVRALRPSQLDRELHSIRMKAEERYQTPKLDFYWEPLEAIWQPPGAAEEAAEAAAGESAVAEPSGRYAVGERQAARPPYTLADASEGLFVEQAKLATCLRLLERKKNLILQGPPGVGKTYVVRRLAYALMREEAPERIQMVQLHQAYSYEDFVQGYRPDGNGFRRKDGVFYAFCERAREHPGIPHVFVVDEINRGNLAKVFGEIMVLIEPDKRRPEWAMPLTYSERDEAKFYVPDNVYLIGMMNTADRSLALVDYALRRRFAFMDIEPAFDTDMFRDYLTSQGANENLVETIVERLSALNEEIASDAVNLGPGFRIGHSYFCDLPKKGSPDRSWYEQVVRGDIEPLLREYCFDNPGKAQQWVSKLLGSH